MTRIRRIQPPELADSRPAGFSQVVRASGEFVFVSGQVALDANGRLVGRDDLVAQTRQVMKNVEAALQAASASFDDVVKLTIYIVDYKPEYRAPILEVRRQYISDERLPASTLVGVQALASADFLIEIEAIAATS